MSKKKETIQVRGSYVERCMGLGLPQGTITVFQRAMDHPIPFEASYHLAEAERVMREKYPSWAQQKQKIVEKYSMKRDEDRPDEKDKGGSTIKGWKKGDTITRPNGTIDFGKNESIVIEEMQKLDDDIKINLDIKQIFLDYEYLKKKEIDIPPSEMAALLPLIKPPKPTEEE